VHPRFLHWAVRHALLGGSALRALLGNGMPSVRRLGHLSASAGRLYDGNILHHSLRGCPSGLCNGRGWTMAPTCDKGHMDIRGPATPYEQRLQTLRGSARFRHQRRARHRRRIRRPPPRLVPLQGVRVRAVRAVIELADGRRSLLRPPQGIDLARCRSLRLGSACSTGHRMGAGRPQAHSGRGSCWM
jgi:hypothetical protein